MPEIDATILAAILLVTYVIQKRKQIKRKKLKVKRRYKTKRFQVNPYLRTRKDFGRFATDVSSFLCLSVYYCVFIRCEIVLQFDRLALHSQAFMENFHMTHEKYKELFNLVAPFIKAPNYERRPDALSKELKFAIVIEFLAGSVLQRQIASAYHVSKQIVGPMIDEVCCAITKALWPQRQFSKEDWIGIANGFNNRWQMPHCIGAVDGKHCAIVKPDNAGSLYYNYKVCCHVNTIFPHVFTLYMSTAFSQHRSLGGRGRALSVSLCGYRCVWP